MACSYQGFTDASSSQAPFPPTWDPFTDAAQSWEVTQRRWHRSKHPRCLWPRESPVPAFADGTWGALRLLQAGARFGGGGGCRGFGVSPRPWWAHTGAQRCSSPGSLCVARP